MKINFKTAVLTDTNGNVTKNAAGEPITPDFKHLANQLNKASSEHLKMSNLDKFDLALQINREGIIDVDVDVAKSIKEFLNFIPMTTGEAAIGWMNVINEAIASEEKKPKEK